MEFLAKLSFIHGIIRSLINTVRALESKDAERYAACIDQAVSDLAYLVKSDAGEVTLPPTGGINDSPIPAPTAS